ncbi:MAG TPA: winged helix-turn-helix domain-containing protein [Verrucomicrobiae bacterium]|nr:winged helix-turn-helix domain-containing protein [Verrucomicrobiae bacterium]
MSDSASQSYVVVFGTFEVDLKSGELRKAGIRIHLPHQPFEALRLLLEHPQQVVSREELRQHLWPDNTYVDYDLALKRIMNRIRGTLGDSADNPIFIETIPRQGYRFIAPITRKAQEAAACAFGTSVSAPSVSSDEQKTTVLNNSSRISGRTAWSWLRLALILGTIALFCIGAFFLARNPIARFYNNRGVQFQRNGELAMAIEKYKLALLFKSGYAEAHYNLADAYEEISDYGRAEQEYRSAIDADLMFYEAYNNLSRIYILQRKDYGAALKLLDRAMSLKPKESSVQYSLYKNYGWANFELKQMGQAQQSLKFAIALAPDRGAAHCLLAKVLEGQGKATVALSEWESCVADTSPSEVEPEWRNEGQEYLRRELAQ